MTQDYLSPWTAAPGGGLGFRPMELLLIGAAGCTAMDVVALLRKMRQEVSAVEVIIEGERREEHPRAFTRLHLTYTVRGRNVDRAKVERAITLSQEKYCSATASLRGVAEVTWELHLVNKP
ncbi:MAG: OsmC family protein [Ardenticatenia bacterium]|nr:OsmC family protein [Ardenticatenia bacterium]